MTNLLLYLTIFVLTIAFIRIFRNRTELFTEMTSVANNILQTNCENTIFYKPNLTETQFINDQMYIKSLKKQGTFHNNKCISDDQYFQNLQCPAVNCIRSDDTSYINNGTVEFDVIGNGLEHDNEPKCKYDNCKGYCENVNDLCYKFDSTQNKFIETRGRTGCVPERLNTDSCIIQPSNDLCLDKYVFKFDENSILQKVPLEKSLSADFQCMYSSNHIEEPHFLDMKTANQVCSNIPETSLCYYKQYGIKNQQGIENNSNNLYYIKKEHRLLKPSCEYEPNDEYMGECFKTLDNECNSKDMYFKLNKQELVDEETVHIHYDTAEKSQYLYQISEHIQQCITPIPFPPDDYVPYINCSTECLNEDGKKIRISGSITFTSNEQNETKAVCELKGIDNCFESSNVQNWIVHNPFDNRHLYAGYGLSNDETQFTKFNPENNFVNNSFELSVLNSNAYYSLIPLTDTPKAAFVEQSIEDDINLQQPYPSSVLESPILVSEEIIAEEQQTINNNLNQVPATISPDVTPAAATTPAETTPAAATPAATTPSPAATSPAATTPAATSSAATTPAATSSAATTPAETTAIVDDDTSPTQYDSGQSSIDEITVERILSDPSSINTIITNNASTGSAGYDNVQISEPSEKINMLLGNESVQYLPDDKKDETIIPAEQWDFESKFKEKCDSRNTDNIKPSRLLPRPDDKLKSLGQKMLHNDFEKKVIHQAYWNSSS